MRSPESYLENLKNLDEGSQQKLKTLNGKKSDFEKFTQGVKGRSKVFSVIANQRLSSPVDTMHQLFLGLSRDLLTYFYDRMKADSKRKLNKTPREMRFIQFYNSKRNKTISAIFRSSRKYESQRAKSSFAISGAHRLTHFCVWRRPEVR